MGLARRSLSRKDGGPGMASEGLSYFPASAARGVGRPVPSIRCRRAAGQHFPRRWFRVRTAARSAGAWWELCLLQAASAWWASAEHGQARSAPPAVSTGQLGEGGWDAAHAQLRTAAVVLPLGCETPQPQQAPTRL